MTITTFSSSTIPLEFTSILFREDSNPMITILAFDNYQKAFRQLSKELTTIVERSHDNCQKANE